MPARLTALDASFLEVETPSAHMHVGWAARFEPPEGGPPPSFEQLRDHISRRVRRAPRYRQRLARVPFGLTRPVWVDDEDFDVDRHVRRSPTGDLGELTDVVMSTQLGHERPLWELWIAERLDDGGLAVVGKAHHCMVDGIAAVELAALLLDPTPQAPREPPDGWRPSPAPGRTRLLAEGVRDRVGEELELAAASARAAVSPGRLRRLPVDAARAARALAHSLTPARPVPALNEPLSPYRHLATRARPLDDFRRAGRTFGATINDVVLAAAAGGVRRFLEEDRGQVALPLKAMVPASVRENGGAGELGNRISFMFIELPCDEPDPLRRLKIVHRASRRLKDEGEAEGADTVLGLLAYAPAPVQRAMAHVAASEHTFNLVVSNIPGPREPLFMLGCPLREAYPVVPLADRHTVSIGFTTVVDGGFLGVYADSDALPDADRLVEAIDASVDELLERARRRQRRREPALT